MHWDDVLNDPTLRNLPYKIELNRWGQIVMTPHRPLRSELQSLLQDELGRRLSGGRAAPEYAIQTTAGVRAADVIWRSDGRWSDIRRLGGGAAQIAPEICIEVLSDGNSEGQMLEQRALYFEAGALEVWLCDESGRLRFFLPEGESPRSRLTPDFPRQVQL